MPYRDPERRREYGREWMRRNPEKAREAMRRWRQKHPDRHNAEGRDYYARHRGASRRTSRRISARDDEPASSPPPGITPRNNGSRSCRPTDTAVLIAEPTDRSSLTTASR